MKRSRFLASVLLASAVLAASLPVRSEEIEGSLTDIPSPPGSENIVIYDTRTQETTIFPGYLNADQAPTSPSYPGGDLQGTAMMFSGLGSVDDPTAFPARMTVYIETAQDDCSGTLIDSRHVLTAGHCVFNDGDWFTEIRVFPGKEWDYGFARGILLTSFEGWTQHDYYNWDLGLITLDRPIGALTGWYGYGTTSCYYATHNTFENYSFPSEGPLAGEMAFQEGEFDWCPLAYQVQLNGPSYHGMSGSGYVDEGSGHVRAVHSNHYTGLPDGGRAVRLTDTTAWTFYDTIQDNRPNAADLIPVGLKLDRDQVQPNIDETLTISGVHIFNDSKADFSGPVELHVMLSDNDNISGSDLILKTISGNYDIDSMNAKVFAPFDVIIPGDLDPDLYYVGLWLDVADANTSNNTGSEEVFNEVQWLAINDGWWDLEAVSSQPWIDTYDSWEDLPVTFQVKNLGPFLCPRWGAEFYLSKVRFQNDESYYLGSGSAGNLDVDETFMDTVHLPLLGVDGGEYYVWVKIIADDEIVSQNNRVVSEDPITVTGLNDFAGPPPNLRVLYTGIIGGTYEKTDDLPVAFSVTSTSTNAGLWHGHFFAINAGGDIIHLASGSASQLNSGDTFNSVEMVPLTNMEPGIWSLVFVVETDGETTLSDNFKAAPQLFEIEMGLVIE